MSFARFFVLTCVVFALVGPLVPMTVAGISSAIATGEADKLLLPLALAPLSCMFGVPLALMYGGLSAVSLFAVAWLWPSLTRARAMQRIAVALCTGFGVPLSLLAPYLASRYQSIVSNLLLHRHGWGGELGYSLALGGIQPRYLCPGAYFGVQLCGGAGSPSKAGA